jgi:nitrilase
VNDASQTQLKVAIAQIAPVWLQREPTVAKIASWVRKAAAEGAKLVAFAEALVPGYPFWVEHTDGARFDSALQKELFAHYASESVVFERGDLDPIRGAALEGGIWVVLGVIERAAERGGHSLYCTLVTINAFGEIVNTHRKLMPTYEERLVWSPGDGLGLRTFELAPFRLGSLNCYENWMPLARVALYGQGEDLHVAVWPGNLRNTEDLTRHMAREGRSYVLSASALMRREMVSDALPHAAVLRERLPEVAANGGSCIAAPDGSWLVAPVLDEERLLLADLDPAAVLRERHNFDPVGHYARPDVLELTVRRARPSGLRIEE